jgi:hypothetical protein
VPKFDIMIYRPSEQFIIVVIITYYYARGIDLMIELEAWVHHPEWRAETRTGVARS